MSNPNDVARDAILRHLYEVHRKAKSPHSAGVGIKKLQKALKDNAGLKQQEVASNLDYLIQKGWAVKDVEQRTYTTARGTTQQSPSITYKISDIGIDKLEQASSYERPPTEPHINITNVRGVTVVGDGNVINTSFTDLAKVLGDVRQAILSAPDVPDEVKVDAAGDIDSLQGQLEKVRPNSSVVKSLWEGIEKAATMAGAVDLAVKAGTLLGPLFS